MLERRDSHILISNFRRSMPNKKAAGNLVQKLHVLPYLLPGGLETDSY